MPLTIPNLLTLARLLAIPFLVGIYYLPIHWVDARQQDMIAACIFMATAITDWFDGYLARKLNQMSAFGAFLDPVADKLLVCASLAILLKLGRVDAFVVVVIISREIGVSALREWMAKLGASDSVAVSYLGKVKTTAQMVAIPVLLMFATGPMAVFGAYAMLLAAALTVVSMVLYIKSAWPEICKKSMHLDAVKRLPLPSAATVKA